MLRIVHERHEPGSGPDEFYKNKEYRNFHHTYRIYLLQVKKYSNQCQKCSALSPAPEYLFLRTSLQPFFVFFVDIFSHMMNMHNIIYLKIEYPGRINEIQHETRQMNA